MQESLQKSYDQLFDEVDKIEQKITAKKRQRHQLQFAQEEDKYFQSKKHKL